jgi:NAD(P)-dependent dehydrogenase (short-subunit alcohol dehydrogenase family)
MTRGILIAGIESSLSAAVAAEAGKRVEQYAAAFIPNKLAAPIRDRTAAQPAGSGLVPLTWNPGSPISARTLVLAAENRLERIDQAILVCTPPSLRRQVEELAPADIDTVVNDHIKSWFFLAKELSAVFKTRGGGALALVLSNSGTGTEKGEIPDLIGPSVAASFGSFAGGLLASSVGKPYITMAFSCETGEDAAFAAFIFKILDEGSRRASGKWHRYGRFNLFGR